MYKVTRSIKWPHWKEKKKLHASEVFSLVNTAQMVLVWKPLPYLGFTFTSFQRETKFYLCFIFDTHFGVSASHFLFQGKLSTNPFLAPVMTYFWKIKLASELKYYHSNSPEDCRPPSSSLQDLIPPTLTIDTIEMMLSQPVNFMHLHFMKQISKYLCVICNSIQSNPILSFVSLNSCPSYSF